MMRTGPERPVAHLPNTKNFCGVNPCRFAGCLVHERRPMISSHSFTTIGERRSLPSLLTRVSRVSPVSRVFVRDAPFALRRSIFRWSCQNR